MKCDLEKDRLLLSFKAVTHADMESIASVKYDFHVGKVDSFFFFCVPASYRKLLRFSSCPPRCARTRF